MMHKPSTLMFMFITALFVATSIEASAQGPSFFNDENLFNNTCAGLAVEDFEDTNIPPGDIFVCLNPMNSSTNGFCYSAGALVPVSHSVHLTLRTTCLLPLHPLVVLLMLL